MTETAPPPPRQSFGRNIAQVFFGMALAPLAAFATAPLLARALGPDGRGEVAAATAPLLFTSALLTFGLGEAGTYYLARNQHNPRALARQIIILFAGLGLLAAVATFFAADFLADGNENLKTLIRIVAVLTLPTFLVSGLRAIANGTHSFDLIARETMASSILRVVLITALFVTGHLTVLAGVLIIAGTTIIAGLVHAKTLRRLPRTGPDSAPAYSSLFGYGNRIWLGSLSGIVLSRVDQLLMINLSTETQLGLYAVAVSIGELPSIVAAAVRSVIFSADAADSTDGGEMADLRLQQVSRLTTAATLVTALLMIAVLPFGLPLLFGEDFKGAFIPAVILIMATVAGSAGSVAGSGLSARGRPGLRSWSMFFAAIVNLTVLFLALPSLGATGAALSTLAGAWVAGTMNIVWLSTKFSMPFRSFYFLRKQDVDLMLGAVHKLRGALRGT